MTYTASEMREMAEKIKPYVRLGGHGHVAISDVDGVKIMAMLQQAADAMEADDTLFAERIGP